jgi:hypothetical protein
MPFERSDNILLVFESIFSLLIDRGGPQTSGILILNSHCDQVLSLQHQVNVKNPAIFLTCTNFNFIENSVKVFLSDLSKCPCID